MYSIHPTLRIIQKCWSSLLCYTWVVRDNMKVTLLLSLLPISTSFQIPTYQQNEIQRRAWISNALVAVGTNLLLENANADDADAEPYESPLDDSAPEERSGLVVLRVAEVCNFQEKILRAVVNKDIDAEIGPLQIVFGTQILLKNSNIAGNMKLMIETEIPRAKRRLGMFIQILLFKTLINVELN